VTPSEEILKGVAERLRRSRKVWLTTHVKSDGDGIGCELALLRALRAMGKEALAVNDTVVPKALRFLLDSPDEILLYDPLRDDAFLRSADTVVVLDVGLTYRLGRLEPLFLHGAAVKICVDHHLERDGAFDWALGDPDAGSTGELLYGLLRALGASLTPDVATPLFTAIAVDTGSFSYERCTSETFRVASELVAAGAQPYAIHLALNWQRPLAELQLEAEVVQRLHRDVSGEVACSEVTLDMLRRYQIDPMEMPAVVNIPLALDGVEVALLFVEMEPCCIKVSARSKGRVRVNCLAQRFGGGGHPLAAGFSVKAPLERAKAMVLEAARQFLGHPSGVCGSA
jgi:phosphoesterase RecJ-like protein